MGSWNHTCAVSNLHITAGQEVVVFLLLKNHKNDSESFCYGNALYNIVPLPFYGNYDDYGGVEECHGYGLPIILEHLKEKLYKFGQGPNQYHDCEVNKENLTIEKLFEADQEGRLGIEDPARWNNDEYDKRELEKLRDDKGLTDSQQYELDRLATKIKKVDTFRQVTHVVVHGKIAEAIMAKWYIEDYVGRGKGNRGYANSYVHTYFKDLVNSIPEYVRQKRENKEELDRKIEEARLAGGDPLEERRILRIFGTNSMDDWNSPVLAAKWMNYFNGSTSPWDLIEVNHCVEEYIEANDWQGLAAFTKEALTAAWINAFMSYTRKIWVKQSGQGSQNSEPNGYKVLSNAVLEILEEERREFGDDENYDENQLELDLDEI